MTRRYLFLLPSLTALVFSCHKDHDNPPVTPGPPSLTTVPVTDITDTTAVSGGTFTNQGTMTINFKGVQWDTGSQFPNHWTSSAGDGTGNFTAGIGGLFPNTLYYVRAYAGTDSADIWHGNTLQFTTTYTPGKYLVSTVAGTGASGAVNGDTSTATFYAPFGVAVDLTGNIFVADSKNNAIREITPSGTVSTFASLGGSPNDVITDSAGNVYVAENDFKIIRISASGQASVFAGSGQQGHADGTGTAASFYEPFSLGIDPAGNLYVGDLDAFRKITPSGVVSTLTDYLTTANTCRTIGVDKNYNFYECDGNTIIKADTLGNETVLISKSFGYISEIRLDNVGNLYLADVTNNLVRMMTPAGVTSVMAGTGAAGARDGNSTIATFNGPTGLALDNSGNIIIADANNNKIRKISPL
jgi:NHL repeat